MPKGSGHPLTAPMKLAVFASGGGSNFQAILDAVDQGDLPADVVLCISDNDRAGALERAHRHDVPTAVLVPASYSSNEAYTADLLAVLSEHNVSFIALAGYLKKIPSRVVQTFHHRMLNIHPALLPAFGGKGLYGMRVHRAVLEYGVRWTGATVHLVEQEYDTGPVVLQTPVPVYPDDTAEELAERVLEVEHRIYPEALRLFAEGRVHIDGRTVRIRDARTVPSDR